MNETDDLWPDVIIHDGLGPYDHEFAEDFSDGLEPYWLASSRLGDVIGYGFLTLVAVFAAVQLWRWIT